MRKETWAIFRKADNELEVVCMNKPIFDKRKKVLIYSNDYYECEFFYFKPVIVTDKLK